MAARLSEHDIRVISELLDARLDDHNEHIARLLVPNIETVDINLSHRLDDLVHDLAGGLADLQQQLDRLEQQTTAIRERVNSLFR